jgi:uncharacterized membrane protein
VGGVSLRSPSIRALQWAGGSHLDRLYFSLIGEVLLLWFGLVVTGLIIDLVGSLLERALPQWAWKSPLPEITEEARTGLAADANQAYIRIPYLGALNGVIAPVLGYYAYKGSSRTRASAGGKAGGGEAIQALSSAAMGLILSVLLLRIFLQSADRGQILFALAGAFTVGALIANQLFPTPYGVAAWGTPVVAAAIFYMPAAVARFAPTAVGWIAIPDHACPLPVDWLSAGGGGAVLGYWISSRLHELRLLERDEKDAEAAED